MPVVPGLWKEDKGPPFEVKREHKTTHTGEVGAEHKGEDKTKTNSSGVAKD